MYAEGRGLIYLNPYTPFIHTAEQGRSRIVDCAGCELSSLSQPYSKESAHMYHTIAVNVLLELDWHVDKVTYSLTVVELLHCQYLIYEMA